MRDMSDIARIRSRPASGTRRSDRVARLRPAIAGAVGALAGIGLSELVAGLLGAPSLLAAIGGFLIDNQPAGAKDIAVGLFGTNDKLAFETVIVIVAAIIGAGLGIIAVRRSFLAAAAGFAAFALAGLLASLRVPDSTPTTAMIVAIVAAVAGVQVMSLLLRAGGAGSTAMGGPVAAVMPNWSRRGFLIQA